MERVLRETGSKKLEILEVNLNLTRSAYLFEKAKSLFPGGVHSPVRAFKGVGGTPPFVERGEGPYLFDVDGNRYTDFCLSWGPLILGHAHPEVKDAIQAAVARGWSYGACETLSIELAELIRSQIPWVERIRFVNSGTEAVMSALRVARAATGRNKILKFDGCYHGHADSMLVRAGSGLAEMASPDSAGVSPTVAAETLVAPLNDLNALNTIFDHHKDIAAVILEPLPANNGLLLQTDAFLRAVVETAHKYGALVIFDEVISGFRVGFGGMAAHLGIQPDLVTYGKILGGGFPVGGYGGRADLMALVAPEGAVYQAGTLSANPVAMTAGISTLRKLIHDKPYETLTKATEKLGRFFEKALHSKGFETFHTQSFHSIFWGVFADQKGKIVRSIAEFPKNQKETYRKLFHALLSSGVYLAPSAFEVGFLSTAHSAKVLDETFGRIEDALKKI